MAKVELEDNSFATKDRIAARQNPELRDVPEKVITGVAKVKKKSLGRKLLDRFISTSSEEVNNYIKYDVLVPGIKTLIYDSINSALSMMFFGEVRKGSSRGADGSRRYDRMYDKRRDGIRSERRDRPSYDCGDVIFETRDDALVALDRLDALIEKYGYARVSDLNSLAGVSGTWTDKNFGWTDLRNARVIAVSDGYLIDLPTVQDVR